MLRHSQRCTQWSPADQRLRPGRSWCCGESGLRPQNPSPTAGLPAGRRQAGGGSSQSAAVHADKALKHARACGLALAHPSVAGVRHHRTAICSSSSSSRARRAAPVSSRSCTHCNPQPGLRLQCQSASHRPALTCELEGKDVEAQVSEVSEFVRMTGICAVDPIFCELRPVVTTRAGTPISPAALHSSPASPASRNAHRARDRAGAAALARRAWQP